MCCTANAYLFNYRELGSQSILPTADDTFFHPSNPTDVVELGADLPTDVEYRMYMNDPGDSQSELAYPENQTVLTTGDDGAEENLCSDDEDQGIEALTCTCLMWLCTVVSGPGPFPRIRNNFKRKKA